MARRSPAVCSEPREVLLWAREESPRRLDAGERLLRCSGALPKVADARLSHMLPPRTLPGTRKGGQRSGSCSDAGSPATVRLPQHAGYSPCHGTPLTTLHRLTMPHPLPGDHANHLHGWDDLHPASPSRQILSLIHI